MAGDSRTLRVVIVGNADSAQNALNGLADSSADAGSSVEAMGGKFQGLKAGLAGLGAGLLAALPLAGLAAMNKGLDEIANRAKTAAKMGLTGADASKAGKLAGDLYKAGWGESTADTGEIVKRVSQDLNRSVNAVDFKPVANKVAAISSTMDQEIGGTTKAVSNLLRNGLAKNANEALDMVAAGFTNGVDKSEDFLDTLNEYGAPFKRLGLDGSKAIGLLSQGLKGGARDADYVADALKEFSIRAIDGSTVAAQGYKALGMNAEEMTAKIAKGGKNAEEGLTQVLDGLRKIHDPVKRNAAAVALFGTKAEDLGDSLFSLDTKTAVDSLGKVEGAADQMANTMQNNSAAKVERFKRRAISAFTELGVKGIVGIEAVGKKVSPVFDKVSKTAEPFRKKLGAIGAKIKTSFDTGFARRALDQLGQKLSGIWSVAGPALNRFVEFFKSTLIPLFSEFWTKTQPVLVKLWQTFTTYLEFIKAGIQGFVTAVVFLWQVFGSSILSYVRRAFSAVMTVVSGVLSVIQGIYNVFIGVFTGNWSRAWLGVQQIFSGTWSVIVGLFRLAMSTLRLALSAGMAVLRGIWRSSWSAVASFFLGLWSGLTGLFSRTMGRLGNSASAGVSAVKDFFVNGFNTLYVTAKGKLSSLEGAVREVPGKVKAALSGLPSEMASIGRNVIQGIVNGIRGSLGSVMSAAQSIVDKIPGPIRKALGIHSPSRVMAAIGKWITAGLVKGMLGGEKSVQKTSAKLQKLITKAFRAGAISKGTADSLHKYVSAQNKKLKKLSVERANVAGQLAKANAKLADLKKAKSDMASSVTGKARDYAGFMGAYDSDEYGDNSASAMLGRLKSKLSGIINFGKNLATLQKRGFGRGIINQIAQAGPEEGGQMAEALMNSNATQIKDFNSTYNAINAESTKLGTWASKNYYDAGIASTEGLIRGLKSKQSKLTKTIENMAKVMVKTLRKKLGIKSPSRVFRRDGNHTGEGFVLGVEDQQDAVQDAVNALAGTRPTGRLSNSSIAREASASVVTSSAPVVHVTVQGNVTAEKALAKAIAGTIRDEIVRNGKRNGGRTGL
ncbi:phage tail tape measure protein [Streptomyces sp. DSM 41014]|uniref:Phage tail tape measure protein n=1 Tax=Streptomyces hintoniae TaxID=3075521 RepID=A0ABU2UIJ1_9ACTN|nr:phage tail tape measure protein [Streptomyces sp. DSM 41014]MDT0472786.1 phage tail tape measure protein [Streptomyces sp. DSM 41014]